MKTIMSVTKKKNSRKKKRSQRVSNIKEKIKGKIKSQRIEDLRVNFMSIFRSSFHEFFSPNFPFIFDKEEKYLIPTIYFPFFLFNQTHFKKKFPLIFFLKFFIHPISPTNENTPKKK